MAGYLTFKKIDHQTWALQHPYLGSEQSGLMKFYLLEALSYEKMITKYCTNIGMTFHRAVDFIDPYGDSVYNLIIHLNSVEDEALFIMTRIPNE